MFFKREKKECNEYKNPSVIETNELIEKKDKIIESLKQELKNEKIKSDCNEKMHQNAVKELKSVTEKFEKASMHINTLEKIFFMSIDELKQQPNNFPAPELNETGNWETTTDICSIAGCEYKCFTTKTEKEALIQSIVYTLNGEQVEKNYACPSCYREYQNECM